MYDVCVSTAVQQRSRGRTDGRTDRNKPHSCCLPHLQVLGLELRQLGLLVQHRPVQSLHLLGLRT